MANASLKNFKLEDFSRSKETASDTEASEDDEDEDKSNSDSSSKSRSDIKTDPSERLFNISQFVKAELLHDFGSEDSEDDKDKDQDWVINREIVRAHVKRKHQSDSGGEKTADKCPHCDKTFNKKSNLKVHILNSHTLFDPADCVCVQCGKRFKNPLSMKRHVEAFHDELKKAELTVICPECGKHFNKKTNLKIHMECVHTTYQPGQSTCKVCNKELKNPHSLKSHMREVHAEARAEDKEQTFQCDECEKVFRKKKDLRGHKYAAHKVDVRICEVCCGEYKNQTALKQHLRLVHGPTQTVSCEICYKSFKNLTRLKHHHLDVHKVDNSVCPDCGKTFKNRFLMKKHLRYLHRGPDGPKVRLTKRTEPVQEQIDLSDNTDGAITSAKEEESSQRGVKSDEVKEVNEVKEVSWRYERNLGEASQYGQYSQLDAHSGYSTVEAGEARLRSGYSHNEVGSENGLGLSLSNKNWLESHNYNSGHILDYRYGHQHHPMAYLNQNDSFGLNIMNYQMSSQLHSARSVLERSALDQLLHCRPGLWGDPGYRR